MRDFPLSLTYPSLSLPLPPLLSFFSISLRLVLFNLFQNVPSDLDTLSDTLTRYIYVPVCIYLLRARAGSRRGAAERYYHSLTAYKCHRAKFSDPVTM